MELSPDEDGYNNTTSISIETAGSVPVWFGCALAILKIALKYLVKPRLSHENCCNMSNWSSDGEQSLSFFLWYNKFSDKELHDDEMIQRLTASD